MFSRIFTKRSVAAKGQSPRVRAGLISAANMSYGQLESRQLLAGIAFDSGAGNLYVVGDGGNNVGQLTQLNSSTLRATLDGAHKDYSTSTVNRIIFVGHAGNDRFTNDTSVAGFLIGRDGDDTLIGGSGVDQLNGGNGDDDVRGNAGNDRLTGGNGNDVLRGGSGDDILATGGGTSEAYGQDGDDVLFGGNGVDLLSGGEGRDQIFGGAGNDNLFSGNGGTPGTPGTANADWVMGNGGDDHFTGAGGLNVMYGGDGNDTLVGGGGEDRLHGQLGNDTLTGGAGNDFITGFEGDDTINGGSGNDFLFPGAGDDTVNSGSGVDTIIYGGNYADHQIFGSGSTLSVADTRGINGTDDVVATEKFRFSDGDRVAESPVNKVVRVQPIIVSNSNGSNTAEYFGNATEQSQIMALIDSIYYQAGIDIQWLGKRTWNNSFANVGNGGNRPGSDLDDVITQGDNANKGHSDPDIIDMYFVERSAGFGNTSENTANGLAFVDDNGITIHIGDNLVSFDGGRGVIARVVAHEIAHNLGLDHVSNPPNLMDDGDKLNASQIADVRDSQFADNV